MGGSSWTHHFIGVQGQQHPRSHTLDRGVGCDIVASGTAARRQLTCIGRALLHTAFLLLATPPAPPPSHLATTLCGAVRPGSPARASEGGSVSWASGTPPGRPEAGCQPSWPEVTQHLAAARRARGGKGTAATTDTGHGTDWPSSQPGFWCTRLHASGPPAGPTIERATVHTARMQIAEAASRSGPTTGFGPDCSHRLPPHPQGAPRPLLPCGGPRLRGCQAKAPHPP